jgi:hypothetical protein
VIKGLPHVRTPDGIPVPMTETKIATLRELAKCRTGTCSVTGVMEGGTLAALVQFGLAERIPSDSLGGARYRVSEAGLKFLQELAA